ncbi:hypothetical protein LOD99_9400 [Oopsacas minuta]|uniref:General vesicular transport factor p115 n=1 Tax=Oopsacas minuta TaxID=111878 RepID=A0AAV7JBX4_9METZ|nr:hypothetical protein LOD99_9400 [Oopsacas minuta]
MDLLSRGFSAVLGAGQEGEREDSTAGVVEKLCHRLTTSTLLQDRRDAMRALRSLSQSEEGYRVEVGAQALPHIVSCLEEKDSELCILTLEAILGLIAADKTSELNVTFSEIVLKQPEVVGRIVEVSTDGDIHSQLAGIRVIRALTYNTKERVQECLLSSPGAISHLMDILDKQDIIRNEVLLVLSGVCESNPQIQKLIAFESGFDRLLSIVETEGCLSGGVISQDCLHICISLLSSNSSNQSLFREGPYVSPIRNILEDATVSDTTRGWDPGRTENAQLTLKLIRTLCSPDNPLSASQQARASFRRGGLLAPLFNLMLSGTVPKELLTDTILTVAEVIWGQSHSQEELARATMPASGATNKLAIDTLLTCMVNDKQAQQMRLACLYALQGYLVSNLTNQQDLLSTLLPSRSDVTSSSSSGRLLLAGLFGRDPVTCWCSSVLLVSALESQEAREELLRVQLSTGQGQGSLVAMICQKVRDQLLEPLKLSGLLCLLSVWVHNCPSGAAILLRDGAFIDHMITQTEIQPDSEQGIILRSLCALQLGACIAASGKDMDTERGRILNRVRVEPLCDMISYVLRSDPFIRAAKKPEPVSLSPTAISLSFTFTNIARQIVDRAVISISCPVSADQVDDTAVVAQYKQLIARQDGEMEVMKGTLEQYRVQTDSLRREVSIYQQKQLDSSQLIQQLRSRVNQLEDQLTSLSTKDIRSSPELDQSIDTSTPVREIAKKNELLEKEQEELLMYLADLDMKVRRYRTRLEELGQYLSSSEDDSDSERPLQEPELYPANGYHSNVEYSHLTRESEFPTLPPVTATEATHLSPFDQPPYNSSPNQLT